MNIRKEIRKVLKEQAATIDLQKLSTDCTNAADFLSKKENELESQKESLGIKQRADEDNDEINDAIHQIDAELYYVKNMISKLKEAYEAIYEYENEIGISIQVKNEGDFR